jgi:hypothetical protein
MFWVRNGSTGITLYENVRRGILLTLIFHNIALASSPKMIFGKWLSQGVDGAAMVTEFSPTTMSFYNVDVSGKHTTPDQSAAVTYSEGGSDTVLINFQGGGGAIVDVVSSTKITLEIPGAAAMQLTKSSP